jgi:hypothetical protein
MVELFSQVSDCFDKSFSRHVSDISGSPIHLEVFVENQSRFEIQEIQLFVSEIRLFGVPSSDVQNGDHANGAKNTTRQLEVCWLEFFGCVILFTCIDFFANNRVDFCAFERFLYSAIWSPKNLH